MIHSYQEAFFRPNLTVILGFVQLSLFGEVDRAINFEFESLTEELTEGERAAASQQVTTGVANAFEVGVLDRPAALREIKARCDALGIPTTITGIPPAMNHLVDITPTMRRDAPRDFAATIGAERTDRVLPLFLATRPPPL